MLCCVSCSTSSPVTSHNSFMSFLMLSTFFPKSFSKNCCISPALVPLLDEWCLPMELKTKHEEDPLVCVCTCPPVCIFVRMYVCISKCIYVCSYVCYIHSCIHRYTTTYYFYCSSSCRCYCCCSYYGYNYYY